MKKSKEETTPRSLSSLILKISIIIITIVCIATVAIVATRLNASTNQSTNDQTDSNSKTELNTTTIFHTIRSTVRTTTSTINTNNSTTLPHGIITHQYEENTQAYLACPDAKLITILDAFFGPLNCTQCSCSFCTCATMTVTTTLTTRCTNQLVCPFYVNQGTLGGGCSASSKILVVKYDCR